MAKKKQQAQAEGPAPEQQAEALKLMQASRIAEAKNNHPYMGRLFASMVFVKASDCPSPMAVDDYWRIYYNPELLLKYPEDTLPTMLYHECMHPLRKHGKRGTALREADPTLGHGLLGLAANYEINDDIVEEQKEGGTTRNGRPRIKYPKDIQIPSDMGLPDGLTYEQYAERLKEILPPENDGEGGAKGEGGAEGKEGSGATGGHKPWELDAPTKENQLPGISKSRQELIKRDVAQKILDEVAKGRGTVPAHLELAAKEILDPHIPWERILGPMVRQSLNVAPGMDEDTYSRCHRRQDWEEDWIRPGVQSPTPNIAVVADTSGSMLGGDELACVLGVIDNLCKVMGTEITAIPCDAEVAQGACQKIFKAIRTKLFGGGGTDMGAGIAHACELKPRPSVVIVATDGLTPWPAERPPVPVIICKIGNDSDRWPTPSWAKVIDIDPSRLKPNLAAK